MTREATSLPLMCSMECVSAETKISFLPSKISWCSQAFLFLSWFSWSFKNQDTKNGLTEASHCRQADSSIPRISWRKLLDGKGIGDSLPLSYVVRKHLMMASMSEHTKYKHHLMVCGISHSRYSVSERAEVTNNRYERSKRSKKWPLHHPMPPPDLYPAPSLFTLYRAGSQMNDMPKSGCAHP